MLAYHNIIIAYKIMCIMHAGRIQHTVTYHTTSNFIYIVLDRQLQYFVGWTYIVHNYVDCNNR